jgi:Ni/Co efflux regulator RcnB
MILAGLSALSLASAFTGTASAQDFDRRGDWNRGDWNRNDRHDNRGDRRYDNRYDNRDQWGRQWRRGDRLPYGYEDRYREVDWRYEHFRAPPYGYRYVRDDRGETLLVGIATGAILGVMLSGH